MKIGLIAMSGVRAHNEELTQLGLTLPGFVERNKTVASLPSLGLLTLAGMTPDEFEVDYIEIADIREEKSLREGFDLVAISTFSAQVDEAYELADRYEQQGIPVVMGGLHVSAEFEEAKGHCTSVVVGEGEALWLDVLADLKKADLQPYYIQSPLGSFDLAEAPMPRFDLLEPENYNRLTVQTSRGCPHQCEFCASSRLISPCYKLKPVKKVVDEIAAIKRIWDKPFIEFADDNSFANARHSRELLTALLNEKIRWFAETDISIAQDDHLLGLMRDSGCKMVLIGFESPRKASLDGIELNTNWKIGQLEHYASAITRIQSYGIRVVGCFVLGLDGDTPESFKEVHDFARDSALYDVQITFLTPFPGTPLYQRLKNEGRILRDGAWELCTLFDINFRPKNMSVEELQAGFLKLGEAIYSETETLERQLKFKNAVRESPHFGKHTLEEQGSLD